MSEELDLEAVAALRKKRQFKKFTFRGLTLEDLLKLSREELAKVYLARARRRMQRGFKAKHNTLLKKLVKSKEGLSTLDKPAPVKTHVRDMIIFPEMVGATAAVYNGKVFNLVDIKEDMVGYYLAEFSISYNPVRHGRPGLGTGPTARFLPK
eukprot:gene8995-6462_t